MFLQTLANHSVFHDAIPPLPTGKYAHFVLLRETESYPIFRTDGDLNLVRVNAGRATGEGGEAITRIVMFKRKQTTAERATGRELLRYFRMTKGTEEGEGRYCEYNSEHFCKRCPDCIIYGFAIGNQGSERSKILSDSAFSLTRYEESHEQMTFNAPRERGTMSEGGEASNLINSTDHVLPQTYFPAVITLRDPTEAGFIYVLNNILRTKRYGAQITRTGAVENHLVAVVFADGEIVSNLKLTQALYDGAEVKQTLATNKLLDRDQLKTDLGKILPGLLKEDRVTVVEQVIGSQLDALLSEFDTLVTNSERLQQVFLQAFAESSAYANKHGVGPEGAVKGKGKKAAATES